jgi:hypothetical protein
MEPGLKKTKDWEGNRGKEKESIGTLDDLLEVVVARPSKMTSYGPLYSNDPRFLIPA